MVRLIESPHAEVRFGQALRWLFTQPSAQPLLVLAPTLEAGNGLLRAATKQRGAVFGWAMESLGSLAVRLSALRLAERGLTLAPPLALEAVCVRVVAELGARRALGRLDRIGDRPGLPSALLRTFSELGLAGVEPAAVPDELGELYSHYRTTLSGLSLTDRAGLFRVAIELVESSGTAPVGLPLCVFDLSPKTELERRLLLALLQRAPRAFASLPPHGAGAALRARFGPHGDNRGQALTNVAATEPSTSPAALSRLQANLFSTNEPLVRENLEADDSVSILSAPGESREAVEIARRILAEAERGVPFDQMAIVLRSPFHYRTHLLEALRRAAIPAHFSRDAARPAPGGRAFLVLLECAAEGISATRFAEYLSLDVLPRRNESVVAAPEGESSLDLPSDDETLRVLRVPSTVSEPAEPRATQSLLLPRRWESLLVDAAVIGGAGRWHRRLDGYCRALAERAQKANERERRTAERELATLEALRTFALPIVDRLGTLPRTATWGTWLDALNELAELTIDAPGPIRSVLAQLEIVREVGPVGLTDVLSVLSERLAEIPSPLNSEKGGEVLVATVDEVRGRVFDVVFVPGLAEKLFPQRVVEDPLLSDEQRAQISEHLETQERRVESERSALALAVGAARRRVVLSYPRFESDKARPRVPSFYALEAIRAAEGRLPGFGELVRRADETSQTRIGWPAPAQPELAIDDAEYDLAVLRQLLTGAKKEVDGAAHYLLGASPRLRRALQFRARRWRPEWRNVDGLVDPGSGARQALHARHARLLERGFAVTALEKYAACPYRFYLSTVVGLSARREAVAVEELDPATRGLLIHELLRSVGVALHEQNSFSPSTDFAEARRIVLATVAEKESEWRDKLSPVIARVWDDAIVDIRADLLHWLRITREGGWEPCAFEYEFGQLRRGSAAGPEPPVVLDFGLPLRGVIDAIEQSGEYLRATDYKTGAPPSAGGVVRGGRALQPSLYALVLEKLYPQRTITGGNAFYCTSRGEFERHEVPLAEAARAAAEAVHLTVAASFEQGFFPAAPAEKDCEQCEFLSICGPYERERVDRKDQRRLDPLLKLRALP
ncbi:MAG TPA: PD-(D/E)XK nuclease family protein [Polyangiaceae bacterium]|nr:PD-(D/E)XK nuclease family protein [Polyangiaceae bacterium]